ncbi:MAG: hypothetical protein FXV79_01705 [Candidatus Thioglobus sp.]|nr:MAG: hypothetical protein FXV79_01705 [Candidatus Thioglobus sp.]
MAHKARKRFGQNFLTDKAVIERIIAVIAPLGKNMIGAFYQPKCVLIDVDSLDTLDARQYSAGMAEVIKYGLLGNSDLLAYLQKNMPDLMARDKEMIVKIVHQSCVDKAKIVAQDELESGKRALLNFGHTFGHALENTLGYGEYLHGEAVAVGMLMAAKLSAAEGFIDDEQVSQVEDLLQKSNLPTTINSKIGQQDFMNAMSVDKKAINGEIRLILLKKLGQAFISSKYKVQNLELIIKDFL